MDTTQASIPQLEDQAYNLTGISVPNVVISSGGSSGLGAIYPNTLSSVFGATVDWNPVSSRKIKLDGPEADIEINGQSLVATLQGIQERLNILRPNEKLEAEWDQLRELGDQYRRLEQELAEKSQAWSVLKQVDKQSHIK